MFASVNMKESGNKYDGRYNGQSMFKLLVNDQQSPEIIKQVMEEKTLTFTCEDSEFDIQISVYPRKVKTLVTESDEEVGDFVAKYAEMRTAADDEEVL